MRYRWTHTFIIVLCGAWAADSLHAQAPTANPAHVDDKTCRAYKDDETSVSRVSIAQVDFSGGLQLPISDQQAIAAEVRERSQGDTADGVVHEALERVRYGWQDHGYFDAEVRGEPRTLSSGPEGERLSLRVEVYEGSQYRLGGINFQNYKALSDVEVFRRAFSIQDGDIFRKGQIGQGLDALRRLYGRAGYIYFTPNPETRIDDDRKLIYLDIDMDEGKQFRLGSLELMVADPDQGRAFLEGFPLKAGDVYSFDRMEPFLVRSFAMFAVCSCSWYSADLDEKTGVVDLRFDLRPCPKE